MKIHFVAIFLSFSSFYPLAYFFFLRKNNFVLYKCEENGLILFKKLIKSLNVNFIAMHLQRVLFSSSISALHISFFVTSLTQQYRKQIHIIDLSSIHWMKNVDGVHIELSIFLNYL